MRGASTKAHWAAHWRTPEHRVPVVHAELVRSLVGALGTVQRSRILEVGAGMGGDSLALAALGADCVALDYLQDALQAVRKAAGRSHLSLRVVQADALSLPFPGGTFDAVFHQGLLEHFRGQDQVTILRENWHVLRRHGIVVVDVPQKYSSYTLHKRRLMRKTQWFAGWEVEFSPLALGWLLRHTGFEILGFYPRGYFGILGRLRDLFSTEPPRGWGRFVPGVLRGLYRHMWKRTDSSALALYLAWSIGVVGRRP